MPLAASSASFHSYLVMPFMGTDLGKLMKHETLSEDRIQFLVYQMLKGLKVGCAEVAIERWVELPAWTGWGSVVWSTSS